MTRRLEIQISADPFVVEQPIMLAVELWNDDVPVAFPSDYEAGSVVTVHVYDHEGRLLGSFDGDTQDRRLGLDPTPRPEATRPTEIMPAGATLRWAVDLRSYAAFDAPGSYGVEVELAFPPSGIAARSARAGFSVIASRVQTFDALIDVVATPVLHSAQVHEGEDGARLSFHLRSVHAPEASWSGGSLPVPIGTRARVAEADFNTRATFEHDFARWLAWSDGGALVLRRFHQPVGPGDDGWGPPATLDLPAPTRWLGRPIEHADGGVSMWLHALDAAGAGTLTRSRWDAGGAPLGEDVRVHAAVRDPGPAVVSSDGRGSTWLVLGEAGALPLTLVRVGSDGGATSARVLEAATLPAEAGAVLGLRLELKRNRDLAPGMLAAVLLQHRDGPPALWIGRAPIERVGEPAAWSARELAPAKGALEPDETFVAADLVTLAGPTVAVLAITSHGKILRDRGGALHVVAHGEGAALRDARLVVLDGKARMVLPSAAQGLRVI